VHPAPGCRRLQLLAARADRTIGQVRLCVCVCVCPCVRACVLLAACQRAPFSRQAILTLDGALSRSALLASEDVQVLHEVLKVTD
jgi:hypothetical protein